ncbi:hypothetical protein JM49_20725 [Pseudomonas chlororaphis subsp. aurantiaca]|uniref:DUF6124 family protein n=1 Tax=Pseudomonas chlororaphis TaxID=587753 RepID=UPI00050D7886|nr:DUF3077 domain-containing protein [Pseudomonas chlororaphis]AIS13986.1 hypothetical protein JM49_20725 [Pseudomonas chlororaphis subsp. aurantiaca]
MKKLVPDPPLTTPRRLRDPELDATNISLLLSLNDQQQPLLTQLKETRSQPFGLRDAQQRPLFAVQAGVNAEEALMHVSLLLKCAEEVSDEITEQGSGIERGLIWSMVHSVEMARAVVDALLDGVRTSR